MSDKEDRKDGRAETVDKVLEAMRKTLAEGDTVVEGRTITRAQFVPRDPMEAFMSLLEKTWKEESADKQSLTTGNAAKMREALEHVEKLAREFALGNYFRHDFPGMLRDAVSTALAAPPRNCDRPEIKTLADAITAASKEIRKPQELHDAAYSPDLFVAAWLLAEATAAQKGGE